MLSAISAAGTAYCSGSYEHDVAFVRQAVSDGVPATELASQLGVSVSTVKRLKRRHGIFTYDNVDSATVSALVVRPAFPICAGNSLSRDCCGYRFN